MIAESSRFPELGRTFYERGPGRTVASLGPAFERLAARGLLAFDDAELAASQFNWLVMSAPLNQAVLLGRDEAASEREVERHADDVVRTFLAAYGKRQDRVTKAATR